MARFRSAVWAAVMVGAVALAIVVPAITQANPPFAKVHWASVSADGTIVGSSGNVSAKVVDPGGKEFEKDQFGGPTYVVEVLGAKEACGVSATLSAGGEKFFAGDIVAGVPTAMAGGAFVQVLTTDAAGAPMPRSFHVALFC